MLRVVSAAAAALALTAASPATAATLITSGGILTGATDVDVGGTLYDVQFVEGTCADVFGVCDDAHLDFTDMASTQTALQALLDQVFIGVYDDSSFLTFGCTGPTVCQAISPWDVGATLNAGVAVNFGRATPPALQGIDTVLFGALATDYSSVTDADRVFVRFTAQTASVPEPATWAMMLLGFGAIGFAMRRNRKPLLHLG
jgi:hypothetical protein